MIEENKSFNRMMVRLLKGDLEHAIMEEHKQCSDHLMTALKEYQCAWYKSSTNPVTMKNELPTSCLGCDGYNVDCDTYITEGLL